MARSCSHPSSTLVQHVDMEPFQDEDGYEFEPVGWFAAKQCDECGAITQEEVSKDEVDEALSAPFLDYDAYLHRVQSVDRNVEVIALRFMLKAVRR